MTGVNILLHNGEDMNIKLTLNKLGVFCGSSSGLSPVYMSAAISFIDAMAARHIGLVYGGASIGLMGAIADRMRHHCGDVIGVIPASLASIELAHDNLSELHIVDSMHERKVLMTKLSDGFVMLPGGAGSLDEFFEVLTLAQLNYHGKPCGILNVNGYYDRLLDFLDHSVSEGFLKSVHRQMIIVEESPQHLLDRMQAYQAPAATKWIETDKVA